MRRNEDRPQLSLVGFASVGALIGVLLAVLFGLTGKLQTSSSRPGAAAPAVTTPYPAPRIVSVPPPPAPVRQRLATTDADDARDAAQAARRLRRDARPRRVDPCLDGSRPECRQMFEAALQAGAGAARDGSGARLADVGSTGAAASPGRADPGREDVGEDVLERFRGDTARALAADPVRFRDKPEWVRRLDRIGREGLPFVRMPRSGDRDLVIGINRKGFLGAYLVDSTRSANRASVALSDGAAGSGDPLAGSEPLAGGASAVE